MSEYLSRDFLRKLNPEVYEKAAEFIKEDLDTFSCHAVESAVWDQTGYYYDAGKYRAAYTSAFGPKTGEELKKHPYWNKGFDDGASSRTMRRAKRERITALLMMAAMVRYAKAH